MRLVFDRFLRMPFPVRAALVAISLGSALTVDPAIATAQPTVGIGSGIGLEIGSDCRVRAGATSAPCFSFPQEVVAPAAGVELFGSGSASANAFTSGEASARAGFGVLGVTAAAQASSETPVGSTAADQRSRANTSGSAAWVDRLVVGSSAGAAAGANGTLVLDLPVSGSLSASSLGVPIGSASTDSFRASFALEVLARPVNAGPFTDTFRRSGSFTVISDRFGDRLDAQGLFAPSPGVPLALPASVRVALPITIGTEFWLLVSASAGASAEVDAPLLPPGDPAAAFPRRGGASALFGSTVGWAPPTLTLAGGAIVTDLVLTSLSGTDYLQPIPEPHQWALLVAGLALLVAVARRRAAGATASAAH